MMRQILKLLPPWPFIVICTFGYFATYTIDLLYFHIDKSVSPEIKQIRIWIVCLFAIIYGACRVCMFHPAYQKSYREWLAFSPWTSDKPLLNGPVHLIWADILILAILTLLAYINSHIYYLQIEDIYNIYLPLSPVLVFCFWYIVLLLGAFARSEQFDIIMIALFIIPFIVFPFRETFSTLLVMLVLYGLCYLGFRRSMKAFPWNTQYWKSEPVREWLAMSVQQEIIGFPHKQLNVGIKLPTKRSEIFGASLFGSLLIAWWLHTILWFARTSLTHGCVIFISLGLAFIRTLFYVVPYRPPISLLGRIFTFHWIIPRYDKVYLAPLCVILVALFIPLTLTAAGFSGLQNKLFCLR